MLARALVVANGKGGVGKSSLVAGLSTAAASGGWKVLVVDLDPHGAVDLDLGYRQSGLTDEGESLFRSVVDGTPLQPLEGGPAQSRRDRRRRLHRGARRPHGRSVATG